MSSVLDIVSWNEEEEERKAMNRKDFIKAGLGTAAIAPLAGAMQAAEVPEFARGAREMGPILSSPEYRRNPALKGRFCSYFCDDAIWTLRDITRQRPRSVFDHPFCAVLKECHEKYGLKMQINLFYRTDFFYGMDEFTLADVTDAYKGEFEANSDWLRFGFHSLQEFPDYPWINAEYADVKKLFDMIHGQVERFAGEKSFAHACVPHWCPMSKDGVRALKDSGIRLMECSIGPRYEFDGKAERLPYGHSFRLLQNRKPETGFYWRESRNTAISASICAYNHITEEQAARTALSLDYIYDRDTGMNFHHMFCDAPCLNLCTLKTLEGDIARCLGREYLIFSNHEQYFFKDYLAYQPEYADKIRLMCRTMHENGYGFIFMEDTVA
ncbi:MAG: hypothetical protein IKO72_11380 [Kiritimatiellae bacterium]|nr:hypothetical protein [Kiritimatiellia bacterium]